jgi:RNA polymerase sigma factor (sigma-70 family)
MAINPEITPFKGLSISHQKDMYQPLPGESKIWKEFKSGSKQAFSHIYNNYFNVLYNYGRKIINDKDLVEDCIQDLFFELWESKEKLSDTDSIKYYLLKALRIKIFKELNKQSKFLDKNGLSDNYDFNIVSSYEAELINEQFSEEQKEKISNVLTKLSKRQKEAIFLRYFDDLHYEEIASIMSINHQSVHNLIHRAITILRENLIIELALLMVTPFV